MIGEDDCPFPIRHHQTEGVTRERSSIDGQMQSGQLEGIRMGKLCVKMSALIVVRARMCFATNSMMQGRSIEFVQHAALGYRRHSCCNRLLLLHKQGRAWFICAGQALCIAEIF